MKTYKIYIIGNFFYNTLFGKVGFRLYSEGRRMLAYNPDNTLYAISDNEDIRNKMSPLTLNKEVTKNENT